MRKNRIISGVEEIIAIFFFFNTKQTYSNMKKILDTLYRYYISQRVNQENNLLHLIHKSLCTSKLVTLLLFKSKVIYFKNYKYLFDFTTLLLRNRLKKLIKEKNGTKKILEIGTGYYGVLIIFFMKLFPNNKYYASENHLEKLDYVKKMFSINCCKPNLIHSSVFDNINEYDFDLIFWNLPYYEKKENYLLPLIMQIHKHLSKNGLLLIGYNGFALKTYEINELIAKNKNIKINKISNYKWNNHEILEITRI